ncbi:hypothetical protein HYH02_000548 [Chlamydomonas schloesseri]|uniref:Uncharacterized protein n=1 Tax=Chlamydomonas schloesseri TaxID=2026947 RepID=A0A835WY42_9CHLO|nr:hypothetical protein HYH02_000548 [Chlamydomonas schloesseri]|eukprot:KAG2454711.1 hypothetical protein HYH02_000548 [Chlamydomonas schloesseri]
MKSPPRASGLGLGYRYSPAKPPGSAAKRLWSGNDLPPLPRPGGTNAQRVATALAGARGPQDGSASNDGSPTRHAPLARTAPGDGRPPLPSLGPLSAAAGPHAPQWTAGVGGGNGNGCGGASRASSLASNEVPPAAPPGAGRGLSQRTASVGSGALLCCSGGLSFSAASEQHEGGSGGAGGSSGSGPSGSGPSGSGASGSSFGATTSSTSGGGTSCAGGGVRPVPLPMAMPMPADVAAAAAGSRGAGLLDTDMDVDEGPGTEEASDAAGGGAAGSKAAGSGAGSPGEVLGGLDEQAQEEEEEAQEADENAGVAGLPAPRMDSTVRALSFTEAEAGRSEAAAEAAGLPGAAAVGPPPSPFPYLENQLPLPAGHRPRGRQ